MREEDPSLINAFQRRNFKMDDLIEQGILPGKNKTEADKRVNATESLLILKDRTISQSSQGIFRSMYFSRSTEK